MSDVIPTATLAPADAPIRIAARVIDAVVLVAIDVGLGLLMGFGYDWLLVTTVIVLGYFALFDTFIGATPGKLALGLRVLGPDGVRPTLQQAVIREAFTLVGSVPFIGPLLALAAWIWIVITIRSNALRQGRHDLLAGGTRVVRVR